MKVRIDREIDMEVLRRINKDLLFDDGEPGTEEELLLTIAECDDWDLHEGLVAERTIQLIPAKQETLAFFFGCYRHAGHMMYRPGMRPAGAEGRGVPWTLAEIDHQLLKKGTTGPGWTNAAAREQPEGQGIIAHRDGWTLIGFWDRSGDSRPGSHSTFLFNEQLPILEALKRAEQTFPEVFQRIQFTPKIVSGTWDL